MLPGELEKIISERFPIYKPSVEDNSKNTPGKREIIINNIRLQQKESAIPYLNDLQDYLPPNTMSVSPAIGQISEDGRRSTCCYLELLNFEWEVLDKNDPDYTIRF